MTGVGEAVERLSELSACWSTAEEAEAASAVMMVKTAHVMRVLQALQGSSLRDTHHATEQPVVGDLIAENAALTKALTGLTCGGSEFFTRKGDRYVADIDACVGYVRRQRQDAHRRWLEAAKANRKADSGEVALGGDEAEGGVNKDLQDRPWVFCPECGSVEVRHQQGPHKQCGSCHQEWFSDVDYTDVVRKNLSGRQDLQAQLKAAYEALEEIADACPATCETSAAHSMADIARQALARREEG